MLWAGGRGGHLPANSHPDPGGAGSGSVWEGRDHVPQQIPTVPSPHNTLYLELWCPAVAPSIVVTSDKGKTIINFGDIAAGVS